MRMTISTKVDLNHGRVERTRDLDELARLLFPGNRNQQRIFVAVFVELKWADGQFLPSLDHVADDYGLSRRVLETVRAKMRRLGIIDHVSRFSRQSGYREGWVFSNRFGRTLTRLADLAVELRDRRCATQQRKDKQLVELM